MKKRSTLFVLTLVLVFAVSMAHAETGTGGCPPPGDNAGLGMGPPSGNGHGHGAGMGPEIGPGGADAVFDFIDELNLTNDQLTKLQDIRSKTRRQMVQLRADIELASMDIQDELRKDAPDKDKINAGINKVSDAGKQMLLLRTDNLLETKKVLTKEQFNKLMLLIETSLHSRFKGGMGWQKGESRLKK